MAALLGLGLLALEAGHTRAAWWEWMERARVAESPDINLKNGFGDIGKAGKMGAALGVRAGDRLISVDGVPVRGEAALRRAVRSKPPGTRIVLEVQSPGQARRAVEFTSVGVSAPVKWNDRLVAFFVEIFSRWSGLLLGLYVLLMRPRDRLAWIVFALLTGFGRLAVTTTFHYADPWPAWAQAAAQFVDTFASASWPVWMLLFGIYFPDPQSKTRLLAWTRWVIAPPMIVLAALFGIFNVASSHAAADFAALVPRLQLLNIPVIGLSFFAVGIFFMNIPYKAAKEQNLDSRRRLRLFFWGANATLMPVLALVILSRVLGSIDKVPVPILFLFLTLLTFFPAVVGYVVVASRAMDLRVAVRQGLQYALASRGLRVLQVILTAVILYLAVDFASGAGVNRVNRIRTIALTMSAVFLLTRFSGRLQAWIDRRFFRDQVNTERMLVELGEKVRGVVQPATLQVLVTRQIREAMHVDRVELALNGAGDAIHDAEMKLPLEAGAKRLGWLVLGPKRSEEPYSSSDRRLLEAVAAQTALALENSRLAQSVAHEAAQRERIQREIEISREVQERIFPQRKPAVQGLEYAGVYQPADSLGGDCFEYMVDAQGSLWLAIGDVAGKGIPAALVMAGVNAALRGLLSAGVREVDQVFNHLNRVLYDSIPKNRFVTLLIARYDPPERRLVYATAGHCPMLVLRAGGESEWLTTRGIGLGLTGRASYRHLETRLEPGDAFLLYTDGVTEARSAAGEEFGEERLLCASHGPSAESLAHNVLRSVEEFAAGAPQHDDITLLAARCTG